MAEKRMAFALRGEETDALELDIYDVIGDSWWGGISAKSVLSRLRGQGKKPLKSRINSGGGDVTEGMAIYTLVKEHEGRTVATIDGLAASMASVIALAFDEVQMSENAMFMIHNPWGFSLGEADDHRKTAELLDKMRGQIADIYVARTGLDRDRVLAMMSNETWLTANEAKELGFVDVVKPAKKSSSKARSQAFARVDLTGFGKVPPEILAQVEAARAGDPEDSTHPGTGAREAVTPNTGEENLDMKNIILALALPENADETAVVAAINKLKASARAGGEIERLVGASGDAAIGAVRALKESQNQHAELAHEVAKVKANLSRRDFESARDSGLKDKKLSPAVAKMYSERFEKALADGDDGSAVVSDLQGFLAVAPRIVGSVERQQGSVNSENLTHGGKTFAELAPVERHQLKTKDPDLYALMRADWEASK